MGVEIHIRIAVVLVDSISLLRMLSPFYLVLLPSFLLFVNAAESKSPVELSYDGGKTWKPSDPSASSQYQSKGLPSTVLFRVRDSPSFISLPACAAERGPGIFEWRGLDVLGVHVPSMCSTEDGDVGFKHLYANPVDLVPAWHKYLHSAGAAGSNGKSGAINNKSEDDADGEGGDTEKRQSFWRKYGLYIAAFVVVSLIQGIREGNAQYKKEQEHIKREAARRLNEKTRANIVVPPKRKAKAKKAAAKK